MRSTKSQSGVSHLCKENKREIRTQEICKIESRRTGLSDVGKIILAFRILARIHQFTSGKEEKLVEERDDIAPRLMDSEYHSAVIVPSQ